MVTTRWHEDDLIGRCLEREPGLWEVLSILLEAMPGDLLGRRVSERLWPEWFTEDMILDAKRNARAWTGTALHAPEPPLAGLARASAISDLETKYDWRLARSHPESRGSKDRLRCISSVDACSEERRLTQSNRTVLATKRVFMPKVDVHSEIVRAEL